MTALFALGACSGHDQDTDLSFIGQPVEISLGVEGGATTRAVAALTTGTAYLNGGSSHMKPYTYSSESKTYTSTDPLVWTDMNMTIYGYYADNGQTAVTSSLDYSIDYSSNAVAGSFLAGKTTASYSTRTPVSIVLRQQLARIYLTVRAESGSVIASPQLNHLYTAGTFQKSLDGNGYGNGGSNGSGWETSGSTETISMSEASGTNAYHAYIIPQTINAGVTFFSVGVDGLTAEFQLASTKTFRAGSQYNLVVDEVSHTLYLESEVAIKDFEAGDTASESNVAAE